VRSGVTEVGRERKGGFRVGQGEKLSFPNFGHWVASDANDLEAEHQVYREGALLEYPQSGERMRGWRKIQSSRTEQPNRKRFTVRRIVGTGDLWVTGSL
jgi:hypothetical protein